MTTTPCKKCGQPHPKCGAHTRAGKPCGGQPMGEHGKCRMHGGASPNALKAEDRRRKERAIADTVERLGLRREGLTPAQLLQETIERVGADLEYVASQAATSPEWAKAYGELQDRAAKVAKAGVDADLDGKRLALDAAKAQAVVTIIQDAVTGIPAEYRAAVVGKVVDGLRALEA